MYGHRRRRLSEEEKRINRENRAARDAAAMTCQICGRHILANQGYIALHGYTRPPWARGSQTTSCEGAKHNPFEVERTQLGIHLSNLKDAQDNMAAHIERIISEEAEVSISWVDRSSGGDRHRFASFTRKNFDTVSAPGTDFYNHFLRFGTFNFDRFKEMNISTVRQHLEQVKSQIKIQSKRFSSWVQTHTWDTGSNTWIKTH